MKHLLVLGLLLFVLAGCSPEQPYVDNGNPGQIKVVFFYDENKNGIADDKEAGVQAQSIAGISQEVACPPSGDPTFFDSDENGIYAVSGLKPGKYCIFLNNGFHPTTKLTQEVYVSSDRVTPVYFGILK